MAIYTSNLCYGQIYGSSASSYASSYTPDLAFDGNTSTFCNPYGTGIRVWCQFPTAKRIRKFRCYPYTATNYCPYHWRIEGSNDGTTWTKVSVTTWVTNTSVYQTDEVVSTAGSAWSEVLCNPLRLPYKYWAIYMYDFYNGGVSWSSVPVSEIEMMEELTNTFMLKDVNNDYYTYSASNFKKHAVTDSTITYNYFIANAMTNANLLITPTNRLVYIKDNPQNLTSGYMFRQTIPINKIGGINNIRYNINISNFGSYRAWSDGTYAKNADEYRNPTDTIHQYYGDIGDGIYRIQPDTSKAPFDVYCDMTNGGWMLAVRLSQTTPFGQPYSGIVQPTSTSGTYNPNLWTVSAYVPFKNIKYTMVNTSDYAIATFPTTYTFATLNSTFSSYSQYASTTTVSSSMGTMRGFYVRGKSSGDTPWGDGADWGFMAFADAASLSYGDSWDTSHYNWIVGGRDNSGDPYSGGAMGLLNGGGHWGSQNGNTANMLVWFK